MNFAKPPQPASLASTRRVSVRALLGAGTLAAGLVLAAVLLSKPEVLAPLTRPFEAIHMLVRTGALAGLLVVAFTVIAAPVAHVLSALEILHRVLLGAAVGGPLAMAEADAPGGGGTADADAGTATRAAHTGLQGSAYAGWNGTQPADVRFRQPNGTDLSIKNMTWRGDSFEEEPYWGLRGTYWLGALPGVGIMFDYSHAKATAHKDQVLTQSGTRDGEKVPTTEPFNKTFRKLEFTHGLNFFTLNGVFRIGRWHRLFQPYVGVGAGISMPHVDIRRAGWEKDTRTYEHQIAGVAVQILAGIEWRFPKRDRYSAFTEYKLTYSSNQGDLKGGGTVETDLWTHQALAGVSAYVWRPAARP